MDRQHLDRVIHVVNGVISAEGFECLEAEWIGNDRILRLFVDNSGNGITIDGCVRSSRMLEEAAELDAMMPDKYVLEVSSPGIERPLRTKAHFLAVVEKDVQVKVKERIGDRKHATGKVVEVLDEAGVVSVKLETSRGVWTFPLSCLVRASLVYSWN